MDIRTQSLNYIDREYRDELLAHLRETIFHVTTLQAYESIQRDGFISGNQDGKFSKKSFGYYRSWVCLFDLRKKTDKEIEDALMRYNFLAPTWFEKGPPDFKEWELAYLLLSSQCYEYLKPNKTASGSRRYYIPNAECWFPGDLPITIDYIQKILLVKIRYSVPKDSLEYIHRIIDVNNSNN